MCIYTYIFMLLTLYTEGVFRVRGELSCCLARISHALFQYAVFLRCAPCPFIYDIYIKTVPLFYFVALHIPCLPPLNSLYISFLRLFQLPRLIFSPVVDNDDSCSLSLNLLALSSTLFTVHIYLCYIIRWVCFEQIPREHSTRSLRMFFS